MEVAPQPAPLLLDRLEQAGPGLLELDCEQHGPRRDRRLGRQVVEQVAGGTVQSRAGVLLDRQ